MEKLGQLRALKRTAGTSAGAINATLVAMGYDAKSMKKELEKMELHTFLDHALQNEQQVIQKLANLKKMTVADGLELAKDSALVAKKINDFWNSENKVKQIFEGMGECYNQGGLCKGEAD